MSITAMRQALEALEWCSRRYAEFGPSFIPKSITSLRQAIAELESQEPVAYAVYHRIGGSKTLHWPEQHSENGDAQQYELVPLYSHLEREWVGLTDEEIKLWRSRFKFSETLVKEVEAKLKEKNA